MYDRVFSMQRKRTCSHKSGKNTSGKRKQNRDKVRQRDKYFLVVLKTNTYQQLPGQFDKQ